MNNWKLKGRKKNSKNNAGRTVFIKIKIKTNVDRNL